MNAIIFMGILINHKITTFQNYLRRLWKFKYDLSLHFNFTAALESDLSPRKSPTGSSSNDVSPKTSEKINVKNNKELQLSNNFYLTKCDSCCFYTTIFINTYRIFNYDSNVLFISFRMHFKSKKY